LLIDHTSPLWRLVTEKQICASFKQSPVGWFLESLQQT